MGLRSIRNIGRSFTLLCPLTNWLSILNDWIGFSYVRYNGVRIWFVLNGTIPRDFTQPLPSIYLRSRNVDFPRSCSSNWEYSIAAAFLKAILMVLCPLAYIPVMCVSAPSAWINTFFICFAAMPPSKMRVGKLQEIAI